MNHRRYPIQTILVGKWLICCISILLSLLLWTQAAIDGWTILQINKAIPVQEEQVQEYQQRLATSEARTPTTPDSFLRSRPFERLFESVLRKPDSVSVQVVRAITQVTQSGEVAITQLVLEGEATSVARVLQRLEEREAEILVTSIRVSPGSSSSLPTRWIVDGVLL